MSYTKPVKQCQDAPITIGTINNLRASQDDTRALIAVEHLQQAESVTNSSGFGSPIGGGSVVQDFATLDLNHGGEHDTPKVARGTLSVVFETVTAVGQSPVRVGTQSGVCSGFTRFSAGSYFVPVIGLTEFYADVQPISDDNTTVRLVQQTPVYGAGTLVPGIYISTWQEATLTGPNLGFTLTEFGFHVSVYGKHGDSYSPGAEGFPMTGRSPRLNAPRRPRSAVFFVKV